MSTVLNLGYKRWIIQTGKTPERMQEILREQLTKRNKMAWMLMKEAGATFDISGIKTAIEFLVKQLKQL